MSNRPQPISRAFWLTPQKLSQDDARALVKIVGVYRAGRQRRFIEAVVKALSKYSDLNAAYREQTRPSQLVDQLRRVRPQAAPLASALASLDRNAAGLLRRRGIKVEELAESLFALERVVDESLVVLTDRESRGAAKARARQTVLAELARVFQDHYVDQPTWHRRKVLVQFLRCACDLGSIPLPRMDHQVVELLPKNLRPPASK